MSRETLVEAANLTRRFGRQLAVNNVSFELRRGEVLGFLGPNGAGKSTTMRMITGNLAPTAGRIRINGIDLQDEPGRAKALVGYLPERPPLYRELTVDEFLSFCARLHRVPRERRAEAVKRAKERCGLHDTGRRLIGNLSKGYQQRVGIAQAILHNPEVVILDEPTVGLDPIQIRQIRDLIAELGADHSVILSTHILPEVQATCSRVQIIHEGSLIFSDSLEALSKRQDGGTAVLGLKAPPRQTNALEDIPGVERVEPIGNSRFRLHLAHDTDDLEAIARRCIESGWGLTELSPERQTLEQIFVRLTTADTPEAEETEKEVA